ncbi:MAG: hypothetical protein QXP97_06185 [Desulfurococcus sp.]|uniref:hypothetical protein n=1 Tax=Desulfurococcus sp. TaxID=51678 RepID=UPI003161D5AA
MFKLDEKLALITSLEHLSRILDDAVAMGYEYIRTCGPCGERRICIYLHLENTGEEVVVRLLGVSVKLGLDTVVDEYVTRLLNYSKVVRSLGGAAEFYTDKTYALGVFYMTCMDKPVLTDYEPVEYEDILVLTGE